MTWITTNTQAYDGYQVGIVYMSAYLQYGTNRLASMLWYNQNRGSRLQRGSRYTPAKYQQNKGVINEITFLKHPSERPQRDQFITFQQELRQ